MNVMVVDTLNQLFIVPEVQVLLGYGEGGANKKNKKCVKLGILS